MIKSIDIIYKRWFDKVNGNSYFGAFAIVNYGMEDERRITVPFQYGYGSQPEYNAWEAIKSAYNIPDDRIVPLYGSKSHHVKFNGKLVLYRCIDLGYGKKKDLIDFLKYPHRCM